MGVSNYIIVCNQRLIEPPGEADFLAAITRSNFHTLCAQYGLDPAMIHPALAHLTVKFFKRGLSPYFLLYYQPEDKPPLVVHCISEGNKEKIMQERLPGLDKMLLREELGQTRQIFSIHLSEDQVRDMGLLLAYEVARWAAELGDGVMRGLDGVWYRLNRHSAFIPYDCSSG